ncbi:MAG: threonine ammonia-lyase, partial [Prevotellaceae bacterium]|nr:threonine ammonia-lyase [Prevotellaceae bacterium]
KLACMAENNQLRPVVASSAGNHAQGVAYAAQLLGVKATIVMPAAAPIAKIQATQEYGAKVVLHGSCYDDAYAKALEICKEENAEFLHPYNDLDVIAGQATLGIEIIRDLPTADIVIVPAGGGGLLAGVACAIKQINPRIKVYGVQAEGADAIAQSFAKKTLITTETANTIADGIAVKVPGDISVELINKYVDGIVTVSDGNIADAILLLMERCKMVVEPAGATPIAAALNGKIDVKGKNVVCLLSGGNIDVSFIQNIIERGLVERHRRVKFSVKLVDKPGCLVNMLNVIASCGANVLSVEHDRLISGLNPNETSVHIACEVGGKEHQEELLAKLKNAGYIANMEE